jgi:hypothetical protein
VGGDDQLVRVVAAASLLSWRGGAILMVFVIAERAVMMGLAVVVCVRAEGAVAIEVFGITVE